MSKKPYEDKRWRGTLFELEMSLRERTTKPTPEEEKEDREFMDGVKRILKEKKKRTTFQKITMVVVWLMLIFTLGSVILGSLSAFF